MVVKKSIAFLLILLSLFSCADKNTCGITENTDEVFVEFRSYDKKAVIGVDFDSVGVKFANYAEFFITDTTAAILPLDVNSSATDFTFYTDSTDYDFRLSYRSEILIENEDCDPVFRVFDLEASSVELDSVPVQVLELSKLISPHVEIYF